MLRKDVASVEAHSDGVTDGNGVSVADDGRGRIETAPFTKSTGAFLNRLTQTVIALQGYSPLPTVPPANASGRLADAARG